MSCVFLSSISFLSAQRRKVRLHGLTLNQEKPILLETQCLVDPCLCLWCVREGCFLCCILGEAGSPLWMGARSQSHTEGCLLLRDAQAGVCMVKKQHGCDLSAQQGVTPRDLSCQ